MSFIDSFWKLITYDLGIDLGTANTMVYMRNHGVVVSEPSVVAIDKRTKMVLAVGKDARQMICRTPSNIVAVRPLRDGVISDFDTTQAMIHHFITKSHKYFTKGIRIQRPRVIIGVPSSVTEVERQAVIDAVKTAQARKVYVVEEAMAAAIGAGLPIEDASGSMIIDLGGGTTDIAVFSLGDMVVDRTMKIAGDEMDEDIINYVKSKYNMLIGERSAEDIKIMMGSAMPLKKEKKYPVQGRDLLTGLPKTVEISSIEVREAIMNTISLITEAVKDAIEETPPELLKDLVSSGVYVAGGGALIRGLDTFWTKELELPVKIVEDPLSAAARGTSLMLDHIELLDRVQRSWEELV